MGFYIAERNRETGKFVLQSDGKAPNEITSKETAERNFSDAVRLYGQTNVMLLRSVYPEVEVSVTIKE